MMSLSQPKEYKEPSEQSKVILVMDNDECLGSWGIASAIHGLFRGYIPHNTGISVSECISVFKDCLVKYYLPNGGARPGTKETLKLAKFYKDIGSIDSVIMFTSASNMNEWVNCLKNCLEQYANVKGLYDMVLHKNNTESQTSPDGATLKCMNMVREKLKYNKKSKIIMVDDKPHNIVGDGIRVVVSAYRHVVEEKYISDMIDEILDILQTKYQPKPGVKTYAPSCFKNILKNSVLVDPNGIKREIRNNIRIHMCPSDQMYDRNLITNCAKTFIENIAPVKLTRSQSETNKLPSLNRSISL